VSETFLNWLINLARFSLSLSLSQISLSLSLNLSLTLQTLPFLFVFAFVLEREVENARLIKFKNYFAKLKKVEGDFKISKIYVVVSDV
jgi:hypothetical protein